MRGTRRVFTAEAAITVHFIVDSGGADPGGQQYCGLGVCPGHNVSLGAALSNGLAGWVVHAAGYITAFLTLAGIAAAAFILLLYAMPESLAREPAEVSPARAFEPAG